MARIRTIKPEFPQSESMGRVTREARLLFVLLWTLADDEGRLRGNSRMLASLLFPYDSDASGLIEGWLSELERESCIVRYVADDSGSYVAITHWVEHQKIDKPSKSKYPPPPLNEIRESSRILANSREPSIPSRARADRDLGPGSRTKDQDLDQGSGPGIKDQKLLSADGGREFDYPAEFERFWTNYPKLRRSGKQGAFRKWRQVVTTVSAGHLADRAADYAGSPQGRSKFAVMPKRWLDEGRWEDEPEAWEIVSEAEHREARNRSAGDEFVSGATQ